MLKRTIWGLAGIFLLVVSFGCDTTQPTQTGEQTVEINLRAVNALVSVRDVWDVFYDKPSCEGVTPVTFCNAPAECTGLPGATGLCEPDGLPDDDDGDGTPDLFTTFCTDSGTSEIANGVPWNFTVEIEVFRAGETEPVRLTTERASTDALTNLTPYDQRVLQPAPPACPPGFACPNPERFLFLNPRKRTAADRTVLESGNCVAAASLGDEGLHSNSGGRTPLPLSFQVNKGDTVVVKARKSGNRPPGLPVLNEPSLGSEAAVDGKVVASDVSPAIPEGGLSYSFTVR